MKTINEYKDWWASENLPYFSKWKKIPAKTRLGIIDKIMHDYAHYILYVAAANAKVNVLSGYDGKASVKEEYRARHHSQEGGWYDLITVDTESIIDILK